MPQLALRQELILYAEQQSGDAKNNPEGNMEYPLLHPEAAEAEKIIRTAWSSARLVAD